MVAECLRKRGSRKGAKARRKQERMDEPGRGRLRGRRRAVAHAERRGWQSIFFPHGMKP